MSFLHGEYLILIVIILTLISFLLLKLQKRFFQWIEDHWFYKRTLQSRASSALFLLGISLMMFALLDLRGPEKKIVGKTSNQKTIILVDSSASMLAEDVRPNRFKKALLLVKHYVKKAVGQQISIVVFSDGQKRIIPFTDDLDLINARINTLDGLKLNRGGTGLTQAIQESVQYFKTSSEEVLGNILIFTDAEETESALSLNIPDGVSVGVVGVGTARGAPIPERNSRGIFTRNKKHKGQVVISKLDESFLKKLEGKIKNFRYWIATSYSLPTEEIISYFSESFKLKKSKNAFRIKPILANYLLIPAVICMILSFLLNGLKTYKLLFLLSLIALGGPDLRAEEKGPVKSEKTLSLEKAFLEERLDKEGKLALASELLRDGFSKESENLYEETLADDKITEKNKKHHFNYAATKLKNKKPKEGFEKYEGLVDYLEQNKSAENEKLEAMSRLNLLKALSAAEQSKKSKSKENEDQENKDDKNKDNKNSEKQDKNKSKSSKDGEDQKQNQKEDSDQSKDQNQKKDKDKQGEKKDQGDKKENKDKKDGEKKDKKDKDKDGDKNKKDKKKKNKKKKGKGDSKRGKKKKLPAILKQLMNDDSQLQKKMIDAKTTERKSRDRKDW